MVIVSDDNFEQEYTLVQSALRDFLLMFFDIGSDCIPYGDFARAELGDVDPFYFLDVQYECSPYDFIDKRSLELLHVGAAVNLICVLAAYHESMLDGAEQYSQDFVNMLGGDLKRKEWRKKSPIVFSILEAYEGGRVVDLPQINNALEMAFLDPDKFVSHGLSNVLKEVISLYVLPVLPP